MEHDKAHPVFTVTIERCPLPPTPIELKVTTPSLDLPRLASGRFGRTDVVHAVVPENRFRDEPGRYAVFQGNLSVRASDPSPRALLDMLEHLRRYASEYLFTCDTIGDGTVAIMAASLRVPVRLACGEDWPEDVLHDLVDYFLASPTLTVPIEPFYSLSTSIGQRRDVTFWSLFDEVPGRNYYVEPDERVSLSKRWAQRGKYFGTLSSRAEGFQASSLWSDLEGLEHEVFTSQTPCAFCRHYPYCRGFWVTTEQPEETCKVWKGAMDRLVEAYSHAVARGEEEQNAQHCDHHPLQS